ncbi:hypothetical protein GCM10022254_29740 [Actinomadura meridiana]|uniref:Pyridoxamine 5'-phosphate oxidase N-terminal domain-containing protein n=1 Tax=Actinomadura meridiana TaxID=559626 RepID=A0ABP8C194_9ACTN
MTAPPRPPHERKQDTLDRLDRDVDAWFATAGTGGGAPHMVPLSFYWDGRDILVATPTGSPTGRNLRDSGRVRVGIGPTRDVVLVEGTVVEIIAASDIPSDLGDTFAARAEFEPRDLATPYSYYRVRPDRIQAWREADELPGRDLMRDGHWLVP